MGKRWSDMIKEHETDIYSEIDQLQKRFKKWNTFFIVLTVIGVLMLACPDLSIKFTGIFLAITGIINISLLKSWAHTKLSMYRILKKLEEK